MNKSIKGMIMLKIIQIGTNRRKGKLKPRLSVLGTDQ